MKLKTLVSLVAGCVTLATAGSANAFGGWLGKQLDMSGSDGKALVIKHESAIQGQIRPIPGQNYRITGTTMTIVRQNGPLVKIDPPTGEHYVVIIDDDPRYPRYQAYSVDCNTYRYRFTPNINVYHEPNTGEYGGAVAYAACNISPGQ